MQEEEFTLPQMVDEVRAGAMDRRDFMKKLTTMGITTVGISAIIASISTSSASAVETLTDGQAVQHLQHHDNHLRHQARGNLHALNQDYAENAIVEDSMHSKPFIGRAAIMDRKNIITSAASEAKITITNRIVTGNQVTAEWIAKGIHTGDIPGLPASGRPFSIHGVTVVIRHDGKIVREALYYDVNKLYRQLG
ncbi:MAG: ester cyclase [Ktedonobacteraceae bacterium]